MNFYVRNFNFNFASKGLNYQSVGFFRWELRVLELVSQFTNTRSVYMLGRINPPVLTHGIYPPLMSSPVVPIHLFYPDHIIFDDEPNYVYDNIVTKRPIENFEMFYWSSFTSGDFLTNICTYANTSLKLPAQGLWWGDGWEDNVNVLATTLTFTDTPGKEYFIAIVYEGNTALADEVITI